MTSDPVAALVLSLAIILVFAKLGGDLAARLRQPPVLGELVAGIVLGNAHLAGLHWFDAIGADPTIDLLARLGVIVLLFEVGLESTVGQMVKVGASAFLVATVGVVVPFLLGWAVCAFLLPADSLYAHIFVGATLCATSVGITARVFKDLNAADSTEARIVLGAAVIDDVQGLIVLAVVGGLVAAGGGGTNAAGASVSPMAIALVLVKATAFLVGALFLGVALSKRLFGLAAKLRTRGVLLATGLSFCFVLAWAADAIGLAPIVGAFAAGLILEDAHSAPFKTADAQEGLEKLVAPVSSLLAPVFFVLMGSKTDLSVLADGAVVVLAALLTVAAVAGKLVSGFAAVRKKSDPPLARLVIGAGMIPRGEVGLIFANVGLGLGVVTPTLFSAVVVMVVMTTLITPPFLRVTLNSRR